MYRRFAMRATDLAELYCLLHMYIRTYDVTACSDTGTLLALVQEHYEEQASLASASSSRQGPPPSLHNPRGAGRKPLDSGSIKERIMSLRQSGLSIRAIASAIHCSTGFVHKLIHEQSQTTSSYKAGLPHFFEENAKN